MRRVLGQCFQAKQLTPRNPPYDIHDNVVHDCHRLFYKWTIVRDPYIRLASVWWWHIHHAKDRYPKTVDLATYLYQRMNGNATDRLRLSQTKWLDGIALDAVVKFERLHEGLHRLPFWRHYVRLPCKHRAADRKPIPQPWDTYITPDVVQLVNTIAPDDCERFGYTAR